MWLDQMSEFTGKQMFAVGEYWDPDIQALHAYIDNTQGKVSLFDVPLHYNFYSASKAREERRDISRLYIF